MNPPALGPGLGVEHNALRKFCIHHTRQSNTIGAQGEGEHGEIIFCEDFRARRGAWGHRFEHETRNVIGIVEGRLARAVLGGMQRKGSLSDQAGSTRGALAPTSVAPSALVSKDLGTTGELLFEVGDRGMLGWLAGASASG